MRYFLITIDTEGDNLWSVSNIKDVITTDNASYLSRFQELCEQYDFIPTYLVNYEMAIDERMAELGREGLKEKKLEIGSHVHAWNQPPYFPIIKRYGKRGKPFLGEYSRMIIRRKLEYLTKMLEDIFQCPILSHRGGRWYMDEIILNELTKLGYKVDCSVTPGVSWESNRGWSPGSIGPDYTDFSNKVVELGIHKKGKVVPSGVLEIPVTVSSLKEGSRKYWLRPTGGNLRQMKLLIDKASDENRGYVEFMLHSSELMPGGSPTFKNRGMIEYLYRDMDELFSYAKENGYEGIGLSGYAERVRGTIQEDEEIETCNLNKFSIHRGS